MSPLAKNPCGARKSLYLPVSVMNVVLSLSSSLMGTEWYAFHMSNTDFFVCLGTSVAILKGDLVWWVCLSDALFSALKSTVLRGSPLCFGTHTILEHHVVGVLTGTSSMMPILTSFYSPSFTWSCQCFGTVYGLCTATGSASDLVKIESSSPSIFGNSWDVHLLKVEAA